MSYPTVVISGTKLAKEIRSTRSEVWRLVQQLRQLGVEIAGHPAVVWPEREFDELVVLCGGCGRQMSAQEYLDCKSICPNCGRSFNPACVKHAHYYFAVK